MTVQKQNKLGQTTWLGNTRPGTVSILFNLFLSVADETITIRFEQFPRPGASGMNTIPVALIN